MRNVGCIYIVQNKKYMCNDRHEKRRNAARKRYKEGKIYAVAADYPLKQGLKRLFMFRLADPKKSCSGLSTKTRIEINFKISNSKVFQAVAADYPLKQGLKPFE